MTAAAGIGYLLIAFSPSLVIFRQVIASDPLRVILFVLGSFFWLISLLFSACVWYIVFPLRDWLAFAVFVSVALQEAARLFHFMLLRRAQKGLNRMTANGMRIAGVHDLHHARHILAVVCGLGMGVMAAVFLVVNVIADFWGSGTVGLPAAIPNISIQFKSNLYATDLTFPITYSLSACMLTLSHVFWTILFWDGCHKKGFTSTWWIGIFFAVSSHYAMSALSFWNRTEMQTLVMCGQAGILLANAFFSFIVMGGNWAVVKHTANVTFSRLLRRHRNSVSEAAPGNNGLNDQSGPSRVRL